MKHLLLALTSSVLAASTAVGQVTLTGSSYSENFNGLGTALPTGWTVRTGATSTSTGTTTSVGTSAVNWANGAGNFRNVASVTGLSELADGDAQTASSNRALGARQTGRFGDPGASFQFNFNSTGLILSALSIDLMMLDVQGRSTTWSLQWSSNEGAAWTNLATWEDPGVWGATNRSFTSTSLTGLNDLSNAFFRVVALSGSTDTGSRDTIGIDNFSLTYTAIPEPSTYGLILGAGALGFAAYRRRRRAGVAG